MIDLDRESSDYGTNMGALQHNEFIVRFAIPVFLKKKKNHDKRNISYSSLGGPFSLSRSDLPQQLKVGH